MVRSRGGNPFMQISLPETSRKLIQSVGRLIRTKKDKGRCTILDNRIHTKRYGKDLINALPPFKQNLNKNRAYALFFGIYKEKIYERLEEKNFS